MTGRRLSALVAWLRRVDRWLSDLALDETHVGSSFSLMPEIEAHSSARRPTATEGNTNAGQ